MSNDTSLIRPNADSYSQAGAAIERAGFGSRELERRSETQAVAAAELAKATIQARYIVAMQRPRDVDEFRVRMLKHAKRPGFAALAEYAKPVGGGKVTGMSIRFVEAALQEYGNVIPESVSVFDDDEKRILRITVTDLERNITYCEDATIEKFVERRDAKGGEVIGERRNAQGQIVYKVRANEDDYANKLAARVSKVIRNLGLRILPADIVEEVKQACRETRQNRTAEDPDAALKKLIDAFAAMRVMPTDLRAYLGHDVDKVSPAEVDDLRQVYTAIHTGEATWQSYVGDAKNGDATADKLKAKLATAAEGDKAKRKATPKVEWKRDGDGHSAKAGDKVLIVEQVGDGEFGWWINAANGDELTSGSAGSMDDAKAAAEKAA